MKVLLHCLYYPPEVGGLESHVAALAEGLVARGHEVRVVTSRSLPDTAPEEDRNGVDVRRTWFPSRSPTGWIAHSLGSIAATRDAASWADIGHAQAFASVLPVGLAARALDRPWVASFHTSHFLERARRAPWKPVLRRLVRWPDHALAASIEIADVAMALAPGTAVEPLANGVETEKFRPVAGAFAPAKGERWAIVPRRLVEKNGVEDLVRAVPLVLKRLPEARFLMVGDGPERAGLEALARELGVSDALRFLGAQPHDAMPGLLCSAEIAIFPSRMEATSVAALEALACERPVVATRVGGLPEIVNEEVGTLVPPSTPQALADGVVKLFEEGDLAAMGRRARARVVARWSNARLVERHLEIYEDLLAGRNVRAPATKDG